MNKPRLIDANKMLKDLAACKCFPKMRYSLKDFQDLILAQPIAYDVDAVVEQLESLKQHEEEHWAHATVWGIEQSIRIVREGAKNE